MLEHLQLFKTMASKLASELASESESRTGSTEATISVETLYHKKAAGIVPQDVINVGQAASDVCSLLLLLERHSFLKEELKKTHVILEENITQTQSKIGKELSKEERLELLSKLTYFQHYDRLLNDMLQRKVQVKV